MSEDILATLKSGLTSAPVGARPSGIEMKLRLLPAADLPVQPPSYEGRLEIHERHVGGEVRRVVELDSVGSSANRLEEGLLDMYRAGTYPLPVSSTTISPEGGSPIELTTLATPHRMYDAWLRLSDAPGGETGTFESSELGLELSMAHPGALDPLLETSAHDLLFGSWDSHRKGPHGQVRVARSISSTVIGLDPIEQARFAARVDPLNLGEASDLPKGAKRLSEQGLSSIPPQIVRPDDPDLGHGDVSITSASFTAFLSFAALRRLGFERYEPVDARVALAALGLHAVLLRAASGWSLRSRCLLVPDQELELSLVGATGGRSELALTLDASEQLLNDAVAQVGVKDRSVHLQAGDTLNKMVSQATSDE